MPLITSPALVISPAYEFPAHHPLVGWRNQVTTSNVAADSEHASYPATNLANPSTYLRYQAASAAEVLITVDDLEGEVDYVGIARHNFGSAAIEVSVEAITAEPGADWEEVLEGVQLANDAPTILQFASDYYVGVRVRLQAGTEAARAAVLYVGKLLQLPQGLQPNFTPIGDGEQIEVLNGRSERGEYLGTIITGRQLVNQAELRAIQPTAYDTYMREFVAAANNGRPFFFAWEPSGRPDEVGFCWLTETVRPVYGTYNLLVTLSLPMNGLGLEDQP